MSWRYTKHGQLVFFQMKIEGFIHLERISSNRILYDKSIPLPKLGKNSNIRNPWSLYSCIH